MTYSKMLSIIKSMNFGQVIGSKDAEALDMAVKYLIALEKIKNDMNTYDKGILDKNALFGFNIAVQIYNNRLGGIAETTKGEDE